MAEQLDTTHTLMAGTLLVYQRERSAIWQCRFKVDDVWQRASMLGFKSFWSARIIIAGIETMHIIKKGQMKCPSSEAMSSANQFYSLAA